MKAKNTVGKIYVRPNAYLGRSKTFRSGFCRGPIKVSPPNFLPGRGGS
mgnify:FL=1